MDEAKAVPGTELREALQAAVRRIVETVRPRTVILFGSWAEGRATTDSDVDLLVVAQTDDPLGLSVALRGQARAGGLAAPLDLLVVTPDEWDRLSAIPGHALHEAALSGVRLYDAA